jgi:hypothetical protein
MTTKYSDPFFGSKKLQIRQMPTVLILILIDTESYSCLLSAKSFHGDGRKILARLGNTDCRDLFLKLKSDQMEEGEADKKKKKKKVKTENLLEDNR